MISFDPSALDALVDELDPPFGAFALKSLQEIVCDGDDEARCRDLSVRVRGSARDLNVSMVFRSELRLGRLLLRKEKAEECSRVAWNALRRSATRVPAKEISSALDLAADCHARAGDTSGLRQVAVVASDVLAGTPELPGLMERLAQHDGSVAEVRASSDEPIEP